MLMVAPQTSKIRGVQFSLNNKASVAFAWIAALYRGGEEVLEVALWQAGPRYRHHTTHLRPRSLWLASRRHTSRIMPKYNNVDGQGDLMFVPTSVDE